MENKNSFEREVDQEHFSTEKKHHNQQKEPINPSQDCQIKSKCSSALMIFISLTLLMVATFFGSKIYFEKQCQDKIIAIQDSADLSIDIAKKNQSKEQADLINDQKEKDEVHYIGILPLQNPSEMLTQFGGLEKYLNENTDLNVELRYYPTSGDLGGYSAVVKDVSRGNISFAYLASVTTVQANGNGPVVPFACAQKNGSPTYRGDLVVKADSPFQSLDDLKGKKVSGTSVSSTSGNLMPVAWLNSLNIDKETYFEDGLRYLGSHDKAAEAVVRGTIDAAFINEATKHKFNKEEEVLRSVWRHDPVPEFPFVVNNQKVSAQELAQVKNALLKMHEVDLSSIQSVEPSYEKWVAIEWEDYLGIKNAVDEVYGPVFYDLENWGKEE